LVVQRPHRAQAGEAGLVRRVGAVVVHLAVGLWVRVEARGEVLAGEGGAGRAGVVGVVSAGSPGNGCDLFLAGRPPAEGDKQEETG